MSPCEAIAEMSKILGEDKVDEGRATVVLEDDKVRQAQMTSVDVVEVDGDHPLPCGNSCCHS